MPNLNAALLVAQMENLNRFLEDKSLLASEYEAFFSNFDTIKFIKEPQNTKSNYWLNAIILQDEEQREKFLEYTNANGVMSRPIWKLLNELEMFKDCYHDELTNSLYLQKRVVNIPSGVRL
jgi:dTDP-4-amino-4,6-dideoxygalactose transaminase